MYPLLFLHLRYSLIYKTYISWILHNTFFQLLFSALMISLSCLLSLILWSVRIIILCLHPQSTFPFWLHTHILKNLIKFTSLTIPCLYCMQLIVVRKCIFNPLHLPILSLSLIPLSPLSLYFPSTYLLSTLYIICIL